MCKTIIGVMMGVGLAWADPAPIHDSLYIDTMVQFTLMDGEPDLAEARKLAIWLGCDEQGATNLFVQAKHYDWVATRVPGGGVVLGRPAGRAQRFTLMPTAAGGRLPASGDWCRLTVKAFRNLFADDHHGVLPCFRIYLDGRPLKATAVPYSPTMRQMLAHFAAPALRDLVEDGQVLPSLEDLGKPGADVTFSGVDFQGGGGNEEVEVSEGAPTALLPGVCGLDFLYGCGILADW